MGKILFREGGLIRTENACTYYIPIGNNPKRKWYERIYTKRKIDMGAACDNCCIFEEKKTLFCIFSCDRCNGRSENGTPVRLFTPAKQLELF